MINKGNTQRLVKGTKPKDSVKKWYAPINFLSKKYVFITIERRKSLRIKDYLQRHDNGNFFISVVTSDKKVFKKPRDTYLSRLPRDVRKIYGEYIVQKFETSIIFSKNVSGGAKSVKTPEQRVIDEIYEGCSGVSEKVREKEEYLNSRTKSKYYVKRVDLFGDLLDTIDYPKFFIEALLIGLAITRTNAVPVYLVMSILVDKIRQIYELDDRFSEVHIDKKTLTFFIRTHVNTIFKQVNRKTLYHTLTRHPISIRNKLSCAKASNSFVLDYKIGAAISRARISLRKSSLLPLKRRFFISGRDRLSEGSSARYSYCPFMGVNRLIPTIRSSAMSNHKLLLSKGTGLFRTLEQTELRPVCFNIEALDFFLDQVSTDLETVRKLDFDSPLLEVSYRKLISLGLGLPCRSPLCAKLVEAFDDQGDEGLNLKIGRTLSDKFFRTFTVIADVYYLNDNQVYPEYTCDFRGRLYIQGSLSITRSKLARCLVMLLNLYRGVIYYVYPSVRSLILLEF
jgi:hypothetical protein